MRSAPLLPLVLALLALPPSLLPAQAPATGEAVLALFEKRCSKCHGPQLAAPKGDVGYLHDLAVVKEELVDPEAAPDDTFLLITLTDPEQPMPPRKAGGPLAAPELDLVRRWVAAGGPLPGAVSPPEDGAVGPEEAAEEESEAGAPPPLPLPDEVRTAPTPLEKGLELLATAHPVMVHFPVALLICAALLELLCWRSAGWRRTTLFCLVLGTLGAGASLGSGWLAGEAWPEETVLYHRYAGFVATGLGVLMLLAHALAWRERGRLPRGLHAFLALLTIATVLVTGHLGGAITREQSGGWVGEALETAVGWFTSGA